MMESLVQLIAMYCGPYILIEEDKRQGQKRYMKVNLSLNFFLNLILEKQERPWNFLKYMLFIL